jgi:hypothetical protein
MTARLAAFPAVLGRDASRLTLSLVCFFGGVAFGQEPAAPPAGAADPPPAASLPVAAGRLAEVAVDGVIGEAEWAGAAVVAIGWEWFPSDNAVAPVETEVLVGFDDERLYVAFRARDPDPAAIRAHLSDRDAQLRDDAVGIEIDTFDDRRRAYRFQVNPLGVQLDAQLSDVDGSVDVSWNAIWDSAGRLTEDGYEVEMAIPFRQLRFPRQRGDEEQRWGFLAYRDYPRSVLHELRSVPNDRDLDCRVCKYEPLIGLVGLETGHNLEVVPTLTAGRTDRRPAIDRPLETGDEDFDGGLTARWGVTNSVALHGTVNPDFSQVEADAAQLDVNERFALFFPEKRPFFLEGADTFATPFRAVFTRTVADPEVGVKLTGKEGASTFGVFFARDRLNNLLFPGPESSRLASLDDEVSSGVVRYRRDVGRTSTLGFLYTGRQGSGYDNHVAGLDGSLRLTPSDTVRFQVLESRTRYPEAVALLHGQPDGRFDGLAYRADYTRNTGAWLFRLFHGSLDDGFRADSGFIPRVGYKESFGIVQRNLWGEPGGWYSRIALHGNAVRLEDQRGDLIEQGGNLELLYEGPMQSQVRLALRPNDEVFAGERFTNLRSDLTALVRPSGDLTLELFLRGGEIIDFVNVRQSEFYVVRPRVAFKLGRHVSGEVQHERQSFEVDRVDFGDGAAGPGGTFLTADLTQGTLIYHFNVRSFFRAIVQYRDVERDLALYRPGTTLRDEDQDLFSQLLFSYKLNPQTVLLAGYSDQYLGPGAVDLTQTNRSVFVKLGYALLW